MDEKLKGRCLECGSSLVLKKTWRSVYLVCRSCRKRYPEDKYKELMDDYMEEMLANVPCNRL